MVATSVCRAPSVAPCSQVSRGTTKTPPLTPAARGAGVDTRRRTDGASGGAQDSGVLDYVITSTQFESKRPSPADGCRRIAPETCVPIDTGLSQWATPLAQDIERVRLVRGRSPAPFAARGHRQRPPSDHSAGCRGRGLSTGRYRPIPRHDSRGNHALPTTRLSVRRPAAQCRHLWAVNHSPSSTLSTTSPRVPTSHFGHRHTPFATRLVTLAPRARANRPAPWGTLGPRFTLPGARRVRISLSDRSRSGLRADQRACGTPWQPSAVPVLAGKLRHRRLQRSVPPRSSGR